jgi:hypothetical protein
MLRDTFEVIVMVYNMVGRDHSQFAKFRLLGEIPVNPAPMGI